METKVPTNVMIQLQQLYRHICWIELRFENLEASRHLCDRKLELHLYHIIWDFI